MISDLSKVELGSLVSGPDLRAIELIGDMNVVSRLAIGDLATAHSRMIQRGVYRLTTGRNTSFGGTTGGSLA